jgi:hypothetical protein
LSLNGRLSLEKLRCQDSSFRVPIALWVGIGIARQYLLDGLVISAGRFRLFPIGLLHRGKLFMDRWMDA